MVGVLVVLLGVEAEIVARHAQPLARKLVLASTQRERHRQTELVTVLLHCTRQQLEQEIRSLVTSRTGNMLCTWRTGNVLCTWESRTLN